MIATIRSSGAEFFLMQLVPWVATAVAWAVAIYVLRENIKLNRRNLICAQRNRDIEAALAAEHAARIRLEQQASKSGGQG